MDTHDTKSFPSDATGAIVDVDRGDSTAVMLAAESLADASCPQPKYQHLVEAEVMEVSEGMCMVASRRAVEATFKNTDVFSSEGFLELGNVRPLIPLSVDPPRHLKYRKILDPIVAPTPARVDAMLAHADGDPDEVLATLLPRAGIVTRRVVAINAVLAGCPPETFPVVPARGSR